MRIFTVSCLHMRLKGRPLAVLDRHADSGTFPHVRSSLVDAYFFHSVVLLMPSGPIRFRALLMLQDCCAVMAGWRELRLAALHVFVRDISP
jgi:hypothetical protein